MYALCPNCARDVCCLSGGYNRCGYCGAIVAVNCLELPKDPKLEQRPARWELRDAVPARTEPRQAPAA